jgi:hypothetical protein
MKNRTLFVIVGISAKLMSKDFATNVALKTTVSMSMPFPATDVTIKDELYQHELKKSSNTITSSYCLIHNEKSMSTLQ